MMGGARVVGEFLGILGGLELVVLLDELHHRLEQRTVERVVEYQDARMAERPRVRYEGFGRAESRQRSLPMRQWERVAEQDDRQRQTRR